MKETDLSDIVLRPATAADHDAIAQVWLDGWLSTGLGNGDDPTPGQMRERLAEDVTKWSALTVAVDDGRVIGMLALYPGKIDQLFLAPDRKGTGVGAALFAEAKRLMPGGFTLWANTANDRARAFYERHGMELVELGPRPDKAEQVVAHYRWLLA